MLQALRFHLGQRSSGKERCPVNSPPQCGIGAVDVAAPAALAAELSRLRGLLGMAADALRNTNGPHDAGLD